MTDDERAALQQRMATAIRRWADDPVTENFARALVQQPEALNDPPTRVPWALVLAAAATNDQIWDALAQVRQQRLLHDVLREN